MDMAVSQETFTSRSLPTPDLPYTGIFLILVTGWIPLATSAHCGLSSAQNGPWCTADLGFLLDVCTNECSWGAAPLSGTLQSLWVSSSLSSSPLSPGS
jgi:hypothetical protein